jgi:transketolase
MMNSIIDELCVNTIRFLSVDAVQKANSGHVGLPLDAAPLAYILWNKYLKHNPTDPQWLDRDRFVLSAGHGSMLLYSLLFLSGYDLGLDDLKKFRQWESRTPGHPEYGVTPGVECTTGPLGQGFGNAVGMAIAEAHLSARYNRPGYDIINHFTYVLASDGDMMEGVSSEAASLAGHLRLGKLICFYDSNNITLSASTSLNFTENVTCRFDSYGWHTQMVEDGNDIESIDRALQDAQHITNRPSLIVVQTHIGYGSPLQDTFEAHGSPLGEENVIKTKENFGWPLEPPFLVPEEALNHFRQAIERGHGVQKKWDDMMLGYEEHYPEQAAELRSATKGELTAGWDQELPFYQPDRHGEMTRAVCGKAINVSGSKLSSLMGGSGDLDSSTYTVLKGLGDFESSELAAQDHQGISGGILSNTGRNVHYGVREHAMGAITSGLALHGGIRPFASTFLMFSDYMRPSIRLAALMKIPTIYLFTHDSIGLGEDGPTHQPIEHLSSLRAIPNLVVLRPADANETVEAWRVAVSLHDRPVALILSRQKIPTFDRSRYASAKGVQKGAYVLADSPDKPRIIFIATGSEVHLALGAFERFRERGLAARVVSMPSWEIFEGQSDHYRESVLPTSVTCRVAVEAGATLGWHRYVGMHGTILGIDRFGASAPGKTLMEHFGFTIDRVYWEALRILEGQE